MLQHGIREAQTIRQLSESCGGFSNQGIVLTRELTGNGLEQ